MNPTPQDDWLSKPWMYVAPKGTELLANWKDTWVKYVLEFTQTRNLHIINPADLQRQEPFSKFDADTFEVLLDALVQAGYGRWWDKKGKLLRVYWRSLDGWADQIDALTKENKTRIINGVDGLADLEPALAGLPDEDKQEILSILVKRKLARWIKKKDCIVRLLR
ncbi:MAG: vacuolar protein-sorting-associated protein 25 [Candidatus Bathyarchaeota archaeon]|nr:vacuolar protein-sorting-associated protein 25 [Candidatus Bathyarchaeota archaeon]